MHAEGERVARIEPDVRIGEGTTIGDFVLVRSGSVIGARCVIGSFVGVEGDVVIGDDVSIQSGCHLTRGLRISDLVFFGPRVTTMNDRRITHRRPNIPFELRAPRVLRAARVGGGSLLLPGVTVGENAFVTSGSVVVTDVADRAIVAGNPARVIGKVARGECL